LRNLLARRWIRTEKREGKFEITLEPLPDILAYEILIKGKSRLTIDEVEPEVELATKELKVNRLLLTVSGPTVISAEVGYGSVTLEIFAVCSVDVNTPIPELNAFDKPPTVSSENWAGFTSHVHYSVARLLLGVHGYVKHPNSPFSSLVRKVTFLLSPRRRLITFMGALPPVNADLAVFNVENGRPLMDQVMEQLPVQFLGLLCRPWEMPCIVNYPGEDGRRKPQFARDFVRELAVEFGRPESGIFRAGDGGLVPVPGADAKLRYVGAFVAVAVASGIPQPFAFSRVVWNYLRNGKGDEGLRAMKEGFNAILTPEAVGWLAPSDLEVMACGDRDITSEKLAKLLKVVYRDGERVVEWEERFWEAMGKLDAGGRGKFVRFATGVPGLVPFGVKQRKVKVCLHEGSKLPVADLRNLSIDVWVCSSTEELEGMIRTGIEDTA
jgi:hypothetical protein